MTNGKACGAIELSSIGIGYKVQDEMLKSASVDLLIARTICSGKYLIVIGGNISHVEAAIQTAVQVGESAVIDHLLVANAHESVFPAMTQSVVLQPEQTGALGIVETFSGVSALVAGDVAGKTARVTLFRLHIAMALGGKGLLLMTGSVSDVTAAVEAAAAAVRERGLLVSCVVIPRPDPALFQDYL
ncbi:MAG: BMC domain-containing protein [Planctomycetaceae bacterium]|jgi:microcompartment protein CcmL/EutN|nr:BMC domain-containing protein [Planctomycetaceae bacterium]